MFTETSTRALAAADDSGSVSRRGARWRRALVGAALVGASLGLVAVSPGSADAASSPVSTDTYGATYADWGARWWQWAIGTSITPKGPFTGGRIDCGADQPYASGSNPVWFLAGPFNETGVVERNCTVPRNVSLLVPVLNIECSDLEGDPFYGETPADRAACASKESFAFGDLGLSLRSRGSTWTADPAQLAASVVLSPDVPITAVVGNPAGVPAGSGFSTGRGSYVLLAPLARGSYVLTFTGTFPAFPFTATATYKLQVV